jgi:dolichol-phosphate mannosyltransferase
MPDGLALRWQLVRFAVVGASGYALNLAVFAALVHGLDADFRLAAVAAFAAAVTNNFAWNRAWTFGARDGHAGFQAARFLAVSLCAFGLNLLLLEAFVAADTPALLAQAIAVVLATPVSFAGNKLWSFRT